MDDYLHVSDAEGNHCCVVKRESYRFVPSKISMKTENSMSRMTEPRKSSINHRNVENKKMFSHVYKSVDVCKIWIQITLLKKISDFINKVGTRSW